MTTAATPKTTHALAARPQPAAGGAAPAASIDVAKILKKYMWLLVGATIVGGILGLASHLILLRVYPIFQPQVVFQVLPPTLDPGNPVVGTDEDEQARFAATQVAQMQSDEVIQRVVSDPRLQQNGGAWYQAFVKSGSFQADDAAEWLQDHLNVHQIPNTDIIQMSLGWRDRNSITSVLGFIRETYMNQLGEQTRLQTDPQRTALEQQVNQLQDTYKDKQALRDQILKTDQVDSLEQRFAADSYELNTVLATLHSIRTSIEGAKTQLSIYQAELNSAGGPTYSDELISAVEAEPIIQSTMQNIASLEAQKQALLHQGLSPDHRAMKSINSLIDSWRTKLDQQREESLRKRFAAIIDGLNNTISQYTAQATELANQQQRLVTRLVDLSKTMVKVNDLDLEIQQVLETKADTEKQLANLDSVSRLSTARRILVLQQERIPDKPVFPDILIMLPAGVVLCLGLTMSVVFLRELLDQRVKGPADVAMIPRTRVLGFVPDASEDSSTPADQVGRAIARAPRGVLAESYRQIRSPLLKQMDLAGHKTVVVLAGMPGSGASTTVSNLADAAAASGKKTLIIDANFRRPSQHRIFGLAEAPGLSDILAGQASLHSAVAATDSENLSLLPAGTAAARVIERLASENFGELLVSAAAEYDAVFIDVPPVIVAGDAFSVANRCNASVLVTKAYAEKRGLVSRIRHELGDTRAEFLGVVVNGVRAAAGGYLRGNIRASQEYAGATK